MFLKREKSEILTFFFLFWKNIFKTFFLSGVKQNYFLVCLFVFRRKNVWIVCMECKKILFSFHMPVRFRKTTICVEEKVLLGKEFRRYLKKKHLLQVESSKNCKFLLFSCCKDFDVVGLSFKKTFKNDDFSAFCLSQCQILLHLFWGREFNSRVTRSITWTAQVDN